MYAETFYPYSLPERNLMIKSEVTKNYPSLSVLLEKHESLNQKKIKTLTKEEKEYLAPEIFIDIYNMAKNEWQALKEGPDLKVVDIDTERIPCGLCHTPNKLMFFIVNKLNGNKINVGSRCIRKYEINIDLAIEENIDEYLQKQVRQATKTIRKKEFYKHFPRAKSMIDNWKIDYESFSLMIPDFLENQFNKLYKNANKIINDYEEGRGSGKSFREFQRVIASKELLFKDIKHYIEENKNNIFVADKNIEKWLKKQIDRKTSTRLEKLKKDEFKEIYKIIKIDGKITEETFSEVYEEFYLKRFIPLINKKLKNKTDFKITNISPDENTITYSISTPVPINLVSKTSDYLRIFKPLVFDTSDDFSFIRYNVIDKSCIKDDSSIDMFIDYINSLLNNTGFFIYNYIKELSKVYVVFKKYDASCIYDLYTFLNILKKKVYFKPNLNMEKEFEYLHKTLIKRNTNIMSYKKLKKEFHETRKKIDKAYSVKGFNYNNEIS